MLYKIFHWFLHKLLLFSPTYLHPLPRLKKQPPKSHKKPNKRVSLKVLTNWRKIGIVKKASILEYTFKWDCWQQSSFLKKGLKELWSHDFKSGTWACLDQLLISVCHLSSWPFRLGIGGQKPAYSLPLAKSSQDQLITPSLPYKPLSQRRKHPGQQNVTPI